MHSLDSRPQLEVDVEVEEADGAYDLAIAPRPPVEDVPLVVDLDGTLIKGDLLLEALVALLKQSFSCIFLLPVWLLRGRAALKEEVARRVDIDVSTIVFNQPLLDYLKAEKARGRRLILATGSHEVWAQRIADSVGLFDEVRATTAERNCTSHEKLEVLREHLGATAFDYAGNATADYPIWQAARRAIVVNASPRVTRWTERNTTIEHHIPRSSPGLKAYIKALRPHQWLKNLLLFVPLVTAFRFTDAIALGQLGLAFVAFSLLASSVYVLNDMVDVHDDRRHPRKCRRPFAAGELSVSHGTVLIAATLGTALLITVWLPWHFAVVLGIYYAMTLAYSFKLKQLPVVDVVTLALLYTTRIVAGGAAAGIVLTFWLLIFSIFVFLSLALAKRCAELVVVRARGEPQASGRGYQVVDLPILYAMGIGSGYVAAVVLALYVNSHHVGVAYGDPRFLWALVPLLLYWIMYVWFRTYRGGMHDDPIVFAARDPVSLAVAAVGAVAVALAV